jgi:hypothetical protein
MKLLLQILVNWALLVFREGDVFGLESSQQIRRVENISTLIKGRCGEYTIGEKSNALIYWDKR